MRALVLGLDPAITSFLQESGLVIDTAEDSDDAISLAGVYDYDVALIGVEGFVRLLRANGTKTPAIVILADAATDTIVRELDSGADDYVANPPPHAVELLACIRAVIRRSRGFEKSALEVGNMTLDLAARQVTVAENRVHLTNKEFSIVELLALRRGSVQTKETILGHLYFGDTKEPEMKIIDVFVCKIRRKLKDAGGPEIETVWGRGYLFPNGSPSLVPELRDLIGVSSSSLHRTGYSTATRVAPVGASE